MKNLKLLLLSMFVAFFFAILNKMSTGKFPDYYNILIMAFVFRVYLSDVVKND